MIIVAVVKVYSLMAVIAIMGSFFLSVETAVSAKLIVFYI